MAFEGGRLLHVAKPNLCDQRTNPEEKDDPHLAELLNAMPTPKCRSVSRIQYARVCHGTESNASSVSVSMYIARSLSSISKSQTFAGFLGSRHMGSANGGSPSQGCCSMMSLGTTLSPIHP